MKRTPLQRRTPLRRGGPIKRKAPRRLKRPGADPAYLAWVRTLPCCMGHGRLLPCQGRTEAHHAGKNPGIGMKAPDNTAIPLCRVHHEAVTNYTSDRQGWRDWQNEQIAKFQAQYRALNPTNEKDENMRPIKIVAGEMRVTGIKAEGDSGKYSVTVTPLARRIGGAIVLQGVQLPEMLEGFQAGRVFNFAMEAPGDGAPEANDTTQVRTPFTGPGDVSQRANHENAAGQAPAPRYPAVRLTAEGIGLMCLASSVSTDVPSGVLHKQDGFLGTVWAGTFWHSGIRA